MTTGAKGEKRMMKMVEAAAAERQNEGSGARKEHETLHTSHSNATATNRASVIATTGRSDDIAVRAA